MGRRLEYERGDGPPDAGLRMIIILLVIGFIFLFIMTSCSVSLGAGREDIPLPTAPQPLDLGVGQSDTCEAVIAGDTSSQIPDNWDDWCVGVMLGVSELANYSNADYQDNCAFFWSMPDEELIAAFSSDGLNRDEAIGYVDAFWYGC